VTEYRVICVVRGNDGGVQALGYSESGNAVIYDDRWTLEQARSAIEEGHRLYTVSPSTGETADLELDAGELRSKTGGSRDTNNLDDLPDCG
jgi:hypothetical protein